MIKSIPRTIWAMGIASFLINCATCSIFSLSALYLTNILGASVASIGLLESVVEGLAYFTRTFSGVLSDFFKRRKTFILIGFIFLTISKPILAFSRTYIQVFLARAIDRLGNGLQAAPRDALISDHAPKDIKGECYGLRQSLALIGSTIGAIMGIALMHITNNSYKTVFLVMGIPAVIATLVVIFFIKERRINKEPTGATVNRLKVSDIKSLGSKFWILMTVVVFFMLGKFGESFICLHACNNFGLNPAYGTSFPLLYSLVSASVAYPIGHKSDLMDRKKLLLLGLILFCLSHLSIGLAPNLTAIFIGTILWGAHEGITDIIFAGLISDYVPKHLRGTGFGLYSLISSCSMVIANNIAGLVSDCFGIHTAFIYGSIVGFISISVLLYTMKYLK